MPKRFVEIQDWGLVEYGESLRRQSNAVEDRVADRVCDMLFMTEHPPTATVGRSGGLEDLRMKPEVLKERGIDLHFANRGGRATFHGPGQLVAYPVLRVEDRDLHGFLRLLLESAADVLRMYGLRPEFKPGRPGLWVDGEKIASVGLAVRRWVTCHGLAMNVKNGLDGFNCIVPCGVPEETATSMEKCLGRTLELDEIKEDFATCFCERFGFERTDILRRNGSRRPGWLVLPSPDPAMIENAETMLARMRLGTVCQSACCPNLGECFGRGTATFMIMGERCTRGCRFCAVEKGTPAPLDSDEPARVANAAREMGLRHAVVTSVARDDLSDGGAAHFAETIRQIRKMCPGTAVEVLTPDFNGSVASLGKVLEEGPDMFNHNLETVAGLYGKVRPGARYERSLAILKYAASFGLRVKSGIMLGLGETREEIDRSLLDLKRSGCGYVTIGQYLAPSDKHAPVVRYATPREFEKWKDRALSMGFDGAASGPLVRSSYRAEEMLESESTCRKEEYVA